MMSDDFRRRASEAMPLLLSRQPTPFILFDRVGMQQTGELVKRAFAGIKHQQNYAYKAEPNPFIISEQLKMGFGLDCSSVPEINGARRLGATSDKIWCTSNNTPQALYRTALANGGCILNLDDESFVTKVPEPYPDLVCFRVNPGTRRKGTETIGEPSTCKYGVPEHRLISAFKAGILRAEETHGKGKARLALHTMIISNQLDHTYFIETVKMLLEYAVAITNATGLPMEKINMGGGFGIPYRPGQKPFDMMALGEGAKQLLAEFQTKHGYAPELHMESGRYMTGPHAILVTRAINVMDKYQRYVGVDASMSSLARPGIYGSKPGDNCYHHIEIYGDTLRLERKQTISGSICEDCDRFATDRYMAEVREGDILFIHDCGAHAYAMTANYNYQLRPAQLWLNPDGGVELIRHPQSEDELWQTVPKKPQSLAC